MFVRGLDVELTPKLRQKVKVVFSRREITISIKRRQLSREFKIQVIREVVAGKTLAQAAREHQIHPNLITKWRKQHEQYAEHAFAGNGNAHTQGAKIAELERLIGQLTIENAFLKKVLHQLEAREANER